MIDPIIPEIHCVLCGTTQSRAHQFKPRDAEDIPVCCEDGALTAEEYSAQFGVFQNGLNRQAGRIEAERLTLQFRQKSDQRLDAGKMPIAEAPLFGGCAQGGLFS